MSVDQTPNTGVQQMLGALFEVYTEILDQCSDAAYRDNGALMGGDKWLHSAVRAGDMRLKAIADGIQCTGMTYTTQTHSYEDFDFTIPYTELDLDSVALNALTSLTNFVNLPKVVDSGSDSDGLASDDENLAEHSARTQERLQAVRESDQWGFIGRPSRPGGV